MTLMLREALVCLHQQPNVGHTHVKIRYNLQLTDIFSATNMRGTHP